MKTVGQYYRYIALEYTKYDCKAELFYAYRCAEEDWLRKSYDDACKKCSLYYEERERLLNAGIDWGTV